MEWGIKVRLLTACILVACILLILYQFRDQSEALLKAYLRWTEQHKALGILTFSATYAVCTVFCVSGALLSLAAGSIFGLVPGFLCVWLGASTGLCLSFLFGRYLLRDWLAILAQRNSKELGTWQAVQAAITKDGLTVILLLRLAPVLPFTLLNYALALTAVPFDKYAAGSVVGIAPGAFLFVFSGSVVRDSEKVMSGDTSLSPTMTIVMLVISGVAIFLCVALITFLAKREIRRRIDREESLDTDIEDELAVDASEHSREHLLEGQILIGSN